MSDWTLQEVEKAVKLIGEKASTDIAFRKLALTKPNEAIKKVMNKEVPSGFKLKIIENTPGFDQTYVLPNMQSEELSDDDLDAVASGDGGEDKGCKSQCFSKCTEKSYTPD